MSWIPMLEDPTMVAIVREVQAAGATSCYARFSAGTIRIYGTGLWGIRRARLEEKLRWALPEYLNPMVFEGDGK